MDAAWLPGQLPPVHPALAPHTAVLLSELAKAVRRAVDRDLSELGLDWAVFLVLTITAALDGPSQEAICDRTGIDRGTLSRLVVDLEHEGLVERRRGGGADRRKVLCLPTDTGIAAANEARFAVDDTCRHALRLLHAKERERLHVLLARALGAC